MPETTPAEAAAKHEHVSTDRTQVENVAETVINDVAAGQQDYKEAAPAIQEIEKDLTPVLGGEPALVIGTGGGIVIAILALAGVLPVDTAVGVVTSVVPVLTGLLTRFNVIPLAK